MSERHEVRVRGHGGDIVFVADSRDGRLLIRQENGGAGDDVCAITLADPEELRAFFGGLHRILESLGHKPEAGATRVGEREKEIDPGGAGR